MKMLEMKMILCMGIGIMGYLYLKNHPEVMKSMKKMAHNMKDDMDDVMDECMVDCKGK